MQEHTESPVIPVAPPLKEGVTPCIILANISWETYERLLAEHGDCSSTHFTYDQGRLQIMVLSARHERPNRVLALLTEILAEEMDIDIEGLGSTTFKRRDLDRGFEPDSCFYIQNANLIKDKLDIDLALDPPPDLIIEVDITSLSLNKLPLFAAMGVPEVWRYDGGRVSILTLRTGAYQETMESLALPGVPSTMLSHFVATHQQTKHTTWIRGVREWARTNLTPNR